jgi:hypothetical protein
MGDPPFSHVTHFGQTSMLVRCQSSVRNTVNLYRGHQTDFLHYRSPITGLGPSKPKIPPLTSCLQRLPMRIAWPSSQILRRSDTNEEGCDMPPSFEVPLLGSNQLRSNRLFFWLEGHRRRVL